ncbi:MAG: hypothetical protein WB607_05960 [Candidatus Acidiferrum sp.]
MSALKSRNSAKERSSASTRKKVVVVFLDRTPVKGYLNASSLGTSDIIDLLTPEGEHLEIAAQDVKSVYFVREFQEGFQSERKVFLSRPKLDGLWVRIKFTDDDVMEGIVANDLVEILDSGVQLTPPDIHGNNLRVFIPRPAVAEIKVLGVVGAARQTRKAPAGAASAQPTLFDE